MAAKLSAIAFAILFLGYPYWVFLTMNSGWVWVAPVILCLFYMHRAYSSRTLDQRVLNLVIAVFLIALVLVLKSVSAKFLPAFAQLFLCWFFGRTLFKGPPLIESIVRLDFPVFPSGIAEYCRELTWAWTLFFAVNTPICMAFALWANDFWWAFYTGVMVLVETALLLVAEYIYRHYRFPDLDIPDPLTSIRAIFVNGRKIWIDVNAR